MLVELVREHPRVELRRLGHERRAEARRERRLRLRDADLGARELRGEPGEEPVLRLLAGQARDRRQDAERVRREEDDVLRVPGHLVRMGVGDPLELVGGAGVLRLRVVVEVDDAALVDRDVLEDRPERVGHAEDVGLGLGERRITFA